MTKKKTAQKTIQADLSPDYGVPKEKIPEEWIQARETMQRHPWAIFHVRKWYFPLLVGVALTLFAAAIFISNYSFEFSIAAGALTLFLYYWNRRARDARLHSQSK